MGDRKAFFYGTLMAPKVLHRVCHGPSNPTFTSETTYLETKPAVLHNHRRHRVKHADYPAIVPSTGSTVRGTFVSGLTDADIWRLDVFEGDEYSRERVSCRVLSAVGDTNGEGNVEGEEVEAETYIWIAGQQRLDDEEWDFGEFQREKMKFWVGEQADHEYAEVDDAVRQQDGNRIDGTGGRGFNGHISQALKQEQEQTRSLGGSGGEPVKSAV